MNVTQTASSISVIICAYTEDRWPDLVAAIESVQQQTLPPDEIIVVIDHNLCLLKRVRENLLSVIAVENTKPRGLSGARNCGIAVARSQYIAFLDDDAIAMSNWLRLLQEGYMNPQVVGIGGSVMPLWAERVPLWLPEEFYWVVGCTYLGMPQTIQAIRNPIGANMSFRREVFDSVGGFRSEIGRVGKSPIGCEETELCIRTRQHWPQTSFLYQPKACVFHRVPGSRTDLRYFCSRCYSEGLSKAIVAQYVGKQDALASERAYTLRTLPRGVARNLNNAIIHHDLTGLKRAGAIAIGLAITAMGYLAGMFLSRVPKSKNIATKEKVLLEVK